MLSRGGRRPGHRLRHHHRRARPHRPRRGPRRDRGRAPDRSHDLASGSVDLPQRGPARESSVAAIRRTASVKIVGDVAKLSRAWPLPWVPKVGPLASATRPRSSSGSAGSSPRSERAQVEPRQVGGLGRDVADLGQRVGEQLGEQTAVVVKAPHQCGEPVVAGSKRDLARHDPGQAGAERDLDRHLRQAVPRPGHRPRPPGTP